MSAPPTYFKCVDGRLSCVMCDGFISLYGIMAHECNGPPREPSETARLMLRQCSVSPYLADVLRDDPDSIAPALKQLMDEPMYTVITNIENSVKTWWMGQDFVQALKQAYLAQLTLRRTNLRAEVHRMFRNSHGSKHLATVTWPAVNGPTANYLLSAEILCSVNVNLLLYSERAAYTSVSLSTLCNLPPLSKEPSLYQEAEYIQ